MYPASVFRSLVLTAAMMLCLKPAGGQSTEFAITHVTVINPADEKLLAEMTVVIHGSRIVSVTPTTKQRQSRSAMVIDGTGKYLIPGLWDMHVHFRDADRDLKLDIANGVLGVRNMGGVAKDVFPLRDAIANGQKLGPKIVACGPIVDGPDSWSDPKFTVSVKTAEEARSTIVSLKQQGADCIKVYDGLPKDSYFAIIDEAKKLGVPVVGHRPTAIAVREASNAGQKTIEHGMELSGGTTVEGEYIRHGLDKSAFAEAMRTRNFSLIPAKIAADETMLLDHFSQARADETYQLLANNGTCITPTLVTQRSLTFVDDLIRESDPRMEYVSADELKWWKPENGMLTKYRTPEYIATRKRQYAKMLEEVKRAQVLGVCLLTGTDITIPFTYPGFSVHDELELFVKAGLTPMQALKTATSNPAQSLGLSKEWGRVAPGYLANLALLGADSLEEIANTKKVEAVVVNGKYLGRGQLDRLLKEAKLPATQAEHVLH